jgi:hypothetical protein
VDRLRVLWHGGQRWHRGQVGDPHRSALCLRRLKQVLRAQRPVHPDQTDTTGTGTDLNCGNDPKGCWSPAFGVVDVNYTATTFPNNNAWDYAFYVVSDTGAHTAGFEQGVGEALDAATGSLALGFSAPAHDATDTTDFTTALGYSYSEDPNFMYCAEDMTTINGTINWWLPSCGLTGGSSGGPWVQPLSGGSGPIISVNSWGYTNSPGWPARSSTGLPRPACSVRRRACRLRASRLATATPARSSHARELTGSRRRGRMAAPAVDVAISIAPVVARAGRHLQGHGMARRLRRQRPEFLIGHEPHHRIGSGVEQFLTLLRTRRSGVADRSVRRP